MSTHEENINLAPSGDSPLPLGFHATTQAERVLAIARRFEELKQRAAVLKAEAATERRLRDAALAKAAPPREPAPPPPPQRPGPISSLWARGTTPDRNAAIGE